MEGKMSNSTIKICFVLSGISCRGIQANIRVDKASTDAISTSHATSFLCRRTVPWRWLYPSKVYVDGDH